MPTVEISDFAMEYLKRHAEPLTDTTVTVLDRLLRDHESKSNSQTGQKKTLEMIFNGGELPSVKFTTITEAKVAGGIIPQKSWNHILEAMISACIADGAKPEEVQGVMQANVLPGSHHENGYRHVKAAKFSFQGLEANRVCKNIALLANRFGVAVDISIKWQDEQKAAFPKQTARIVLP